MGTRNLTCVFHEGRYKVAQYCQWDGYPEGQGKAILEFLRRVDLARFTKKLARCHFVDDKTIEALWIGAGAKPGDNFMSLEVADQLKKDHPQISRDTGATVLDLIYRGEGPLPLKDSIDFANDSLFCEWAYVIDLDKGTFEVYEGFNREPLKPRERFADAAKIKGNEYFPVRLKHRFRLSKLPTAKTFLAKCKRKEE